VQRRNTDFEPGVAPQEQGALKGLKPARRARTSQSLEIKENQAPAGLSDQRRRSVEPLNGWSPSPDPSEAPSISVGSQHRSHGGSRNFADRQTDSLSLSQCQNLLSAAAAGLQMGFHWNRWITIDLGKAGIPQEGGAQFIGHYLKQAGDWCRRHGGQISWIYVREAGPLGGHHVHILVYVAPSLYAQFRRFKLHRRWMEVAGGRYSRKVFRSRGVRGTASGRCRDDAYYRQNVANIVKYMLKGAGAEACEKLGLASKPQGTIVGKRMGASQNVGSHARKLFAAVMIKSAVAEGMPSSRPVSAEVSTGIDHGTRFPRCPQANSLANRTIHIDLRSNHPDGRLCSVSALPRGPPELARIE
jgi:hypothetical protein